MLFRRAPRHRRILTQCMDYLRRDDHKTPSLLYKLAPLASLTLYFTYGLIIYLYSDYTDIPQSSDHLIDNQGVRISSRHLLLVNTTDDQTTPAEHQGGLPWEQCEFERGSPYKIGWVIHHLWWIFFFFIGLAVVCDDFFVPALEVISEKLKLSEDVAGATFMAAGSSAPELFTSLMGVAQETDVGVGAIVGSAVFNILMIIALTGALAGQVLQLDWRPLVRDITFYAVSICAFLGVAYDGQVTWYEGLILLLLYVLYIVTMVFNPKLMNLMSRPCCCSPSLTEPDGGTAEQNAAYTAEEDNAAASEFRQVSFKKSSFSGGHARRLSLHAQLHHNRRRGSSIGQLPEGGLPLPSANRPSRRDSGFSDDKLSMASKNMHSSATNTTNLSDVNSHSNSAATAATGCHGGSNAIILPPIQKSSNGALLGHTDNHHKSSKETTVDPDEGSEAKLNEESETEDSANSLKPSIPDDDGEDDSADDEIVVCEASYCPRIRSTPPKPPVGRSRTCWKMFVYGMKWFLYIIAFPFYFLFTFTIPDCSKEHNKKWYLATFLMSIFWILALSFAMVTMVSRTGCIIGVDEFVMGLVIVAIGTSVPDCLSSILVARDGFGDMAVSNAIGSNVFDIDLGLGFPFLLRILIQAGKPLILLDSEQQTLLAEGKFVVIPHVKFALILLGLLILVFLLFLISKFRLNRFISISFVVLYLVFIAYALVQQLVCHTYMC